MLQSCDLLKPSYVCVHFGPPHKVEIARQEMDGSSIRVIECDVSSVNADGALFDVISSVLAFPDYFGENWDALDECLRDLKAWLPAPGYVLIAHGATNLWRTATYTAGKFVMSWQFSAEEWAKEGIPFHLVFVVDG